MSEQKIETKDYRGFEYEKETNTRYYYVKDLKFKIKDIDIETLNRWDNQMELLRNDKLSDIEGYNLEKSMSEEILTICLDGYNSTIKNKLHPKVRQAIAGEVFSFLLLIPTKEEQDLLRMRFQQDKVTDT